MTAIIKLIFGFFPWLMRLLSGYLGTLVGFFTAYMSRKYAMYAAIVAIFMSLHAAFILFMQGLIVGLAVVTPPELVSAWSWVAPSNVVDCMTAIFAAKSARYLFDMNIGLMFRGTF